MSRLHPIKIPNSADCNIVFVHGLSGDWFDTWHSTDTLIPNSSCILKSIKDPHYFPFMISNAFPTTAVYSVGYSISVSRWTGTTMSLQDRAKNLFKLFFRRKLFKRPILFITHSMGGLVIKQLWRQFYDSTYIRSSVRGIIFLATPNGGAYLAGCANTCLDIDKTCGCIDFATKPTITLNELDPKSEILHDLDNWYQDHQIPFQRGYAENEPLFGLFKIVDEYSVGENAIPINADHISICKPSGQDDPIYLEISQTIENFRKSMTPVV